MTAGIGAVIGGAVGDSSYNAQLAGVIGQNAVENNYLTLKQIEQFDKEMGDCKNNRACENKINEKYARIALEQDKELAAICSVDAVLCRQKYGFLITSKNELITALNKTKNLSALVESSLYYQRFAAQGLIFNVRLAEQAKEKFNLSDEEAQYIKMAASAAAAGKAIKSKPAANNRTPVPEATKASNGLTYKSNTKHTAGENGFNKKAGIEPKESFKLFEDSVLFKNKRYSMDSNGHVHQFTYTGSGDNTWHWAGSTADKGNPLQLQNDQKSALRKLGWTSKQGILK